MFHRLGVHDILFRPEPVAYELLLPESITILEMLQPRSSSRIRVLTSCQNH